MKKGFFLLFMMMSSLSVFANEKVTSALNEYAWEKRQLIVFAPSKEHTQYQLFKKVTVEFGDELKERKLHTWHVIANDPVRLDSKIQDGIKSQDFREAYTVSNDEFRLLLIGYDQGEKLRQKQVNIDYLFSEIDQMPMRIQEMQ